ncbi:radical SAM (seleno)protein TrsS [uncultured Desulfobulbus sp.]|uniref:radical SAM (seleno)protein TrsS n=1 Tax=uncultured Desulfobulbus sp. TaxID=239745 RepID=UPI0029C62466|nr:radical SAM (seleno)protein TrsS [uncultured Desulfobulbus sp.]
MLADRPIQLLSSTESLCPVCLQRVAAIREQQGNTVYQVKHCPEHGTFRTPIWRGSIPFASWLRPKKPSAPRQTFTAGENGCPFDCGLCPEHGQHTCTALIEITSRCNLRCPVCFADAGGEAAAAEPTLDQIGFLYDRILAASGLCNIQLSGGEPTMRDDLAAIVELGRSKGFGFIQLNSNGLHLAADPEYAFSLKAAGLASVFLQFDGLSSGVHIALRGRDLREIKEQAIAHCASAGLGVVLVPTLIPGVNTSEIGAVIDYAIRRAPTVRGVHFQPISYFGRYPQGPADDDRLTLPEVIELLQAQCGGAIRAEHFAPPSCEHALCSFHGNFLVEEDGRLTPLGNRQSACCSTGEPKAIIPTALEGREKSVDFTARQWSAPPLPLALAAAPCVCEHELQKPLDDFDRFLARARTHTFSISAMAFQDAWNLDLERLHGCCIHVVSPEGKLIPFCAYNMTSNLGKPLYRGLKRP